MDSTPVEPGLVTDTTLGVEGPAEQLPVNDSAADQTTLVNNDVDDLDTDQPGGTDG